MHLYTFYYFFISFAFLTFADPDTQSEAFKVLDGKVIAKKTYKAYKFTDFIAIRNISKEYKPPEIHPFIEIVFFCNFF